MIEITTDQETADMLWQIATLERCSLNHAAEIVIKRYTKRALRVVKDAQDLADKF